MRHHCLKQSTNQSVNHIVLFNETNSYYKEHRVNVGEKQIVYDSPGYE